MCDAAAVRRRPILVFVMIALGCTGCGAAGSRTTATAAQTAAQATATQAHSASPTTARQTPSAPRTRRARAHYVIVRHAARRARTAGVRAPHITWDPIPFGPTRKAQTVAYVLRHYHSFMRPTWRLAHPHVMVIHYTEASYAATINTFASDVPDSELHELPATSAHFVVDTNGTIHQLVSVGTIARHTVGLNWTAIGIEHVGYSDAQVLDNPRQMSSSLHLVHWLQCRFHIQTRNVIGHNESLSSPYHHEDVPSLRTQTHSDFMHRDMQVYRGRLRALGGC
jgi:N-acetylmuramoyl-L-alanine amidase